MIRALQRVYEQETGCCLLYKMTVLSIVTEESEDAVVYGVSVEKFAEDGIVPVGEAAVYQDISVNEDLVRDLYQKIVYCRVTPIHLHDVVQDYIAI